MTSKENPGDRAPAFPSNINEPVTSTFQFRTKKGLSHITVEYQAPRTENSSIGADNKSDQHGNGWKQLKSSPRIKKGETASAVGEMMVTKIRSSSGYRSNYNNQEQNSDTQQINYTKEQPDHCAENHLEKFQESLEKVDVNVAADVRNEKNLLKYKPEERLKHMETYVQAFNDTDSSSFKDSRIGSRRPPT